MEFAIWFILLSITLFILLGPYRISILFIQVERNRSIGLRVTSWMQLYGLEWLRGEEGNSFRLILFNKSLRRMVKCTKNGRTEEKIQKSGKNKLKMKLLHAAVRTVPRAVDRLIHLIKRIKIERLNIKGRFGLGNPASTGKAFGLVAALRCLEGGRFSTELIPEFRKKTTDVRVDLILRMVMANFMLWLICTGIQMVWTCRKQKIR
jgi:hypothetical protein